MLESAELEGAKSDPKPTSTEPTLDYLLLFAMRSAKCRKNQPIRKMVRAKIKL